jgi:hypothetical protein
MTTALVSVFLFVHGFVHLLVWLARAKVDEPFDPRHSWALAAAGVPGPRIPGTLAVSLASVTTMLYVIAGAAAATQAEGWATAALLAAATGLFLKALWFNPWLSFGVVLDIGVIAAVLASWPASLY